MEQQFHCHILYVWFSGESVSTNEEDTIPTYTSLLTPLYITVADMLLQICTLATSYNTTLNVECLMKNAQTLCINVVE